MKKLRENRLRWFEHVLRREKAVRLVKGMYVERKLEEKVQKKVGKCNRELYELVGGYKGRGCGRLS